MGALAVHTGVVTQTIDYTYDPLYRLTSADYSGGDSYSYTYDAVGNRLSQDDIVGGLPTSLAYTYDIANRLTAVGSVSYTWDANGNLLNDGTNTYAYDSANRLKAVSGGQTAVSYTYNGLGNRLQQTANSTTITYVNDLNAGLTQVLSDGTNTYLYGNVRIAQLPAGDPQKADYFLGDALGSVRQMADETGAVVYAASFDPYGEVLSTNGDVQTSYGYAGENTDSYIKLIDLRSRQYSPSTGTFLTRDSWQGDYNRPQSLDRWAYTEGNPINFADPSGFSIESDYGISLSGTWPNYGITSVHEGVEAVGDRLRSVLGGSSASAFRLVYYRGVSFQWDTNCFNCRQNTEAHPCIDTNDFGQIDPDCKPGGAATLSSSSIMFASTWKLSPITARNLVVHELGHVFSRILSSSTANYGNNGAGDILYRGVWQGNWAKLNCNDDWPNRWKTAYGPNYGFASDGVNDLTWQLHFMQDQGLYAANEEFADMFLGWVFNKWETDASNSLTYAGGMRSDWMNHWMPIWLRFITVSRSYANEN
jgi:RHS repeat-associated protein